MRTVSPARSAGSLSAIVLPETFRLRDSWLGFRQTTQVGSALRNNHIIALNPGFSPLKTFIPRRSFPHYKIQMVDVYSFGYQEPHAMEVRFEVIAEGFIEINAETRHSYSENERFDHRGSEGLVLHLSIVPWSSSRLQRVPRDPRGAIQLGRGSTNWCLPGWIGHTRREAACFIRGIAAGNSPRPFLEP